MTGWLGRRRARQEAEILACLADGEARTGPTICREIGRKSGTIHPTLARLEGDRRIISFWEDTDPDERPRRRFYRGVL
jgi:DNA-binding PadR family transcriptional regulator